jgi:hypothetical protein
MIYEPVIMYLYDVQFFTRGNRVFYNSDDGGSLYLG